MPALPPAQSDRTERPMVLASPSRPSTPPKPAMPEKPAIISAVPPSPPGEVALPAPAEKPAQIFPASASETPVPPARPEFEEDAGQPPKEKRVTGAKAPPASLPTVDQAPTGRGAEPLELPAEDDFREEQVLDTPSGAPADMSQVASAEVDEEGLAFLLPAERGVPEVIAQPKLPQALRPPGVPVPRPGRTAQPAEDQLLVASLPQPRQATKPPSPQALLPEPVADPNVVFIVPFQSVMVPRQVESRLFDRFIETLSTEDSEGGFQFVILKEGLQEVDPDWLASRNYVTGEIYAYVEESGCCSTDLRTKARLVYYRPHQKAPAFAFNYPAQNFFDHDRSTLEVERRKLADEVSQVLAGELLKALSP